MQSKNDQINAILSKFVSLKNDIDDLQISLPKGPEARELLPFSLATFELAYAFRKAVEKHGYAALEAKQ